MKLCKDCKHYKKDWIAHILGHGDIYDLCLNPLATGNLVTGKSNGLYCDSVRRFHGCGIEGNYWEAK